MRIKAFDHISLAVGEPEAAVEFYGSLLGMGSPADLDKGRLRFSHGHETAGAFIDLVMVGPGLRGRAGGGGIHHFALGTTDGTTLRMWKRWLSDRGIMVSGPYDRTYFESIYFRDPDGHIVEIATEGPGYLIDESPEDLGKRVLPASRGVAGSRDERAIAADTFQDSVGEIRPEMTLRSIHHVSALTPDLNEADAFYRSLGLDLIKKTVNRDDPSMPHWFWAARDGLDILPNSSLTLFGWPDGYRTIRHGPGQAIDLGFRVDEAGDSERLDAPDGLRLELTSGEGARERAYSR